MMSKEKVLKSLQLELDDYRSQVKSFREMADDDKWQHLSHTAHHAAVAIQMVEHIESMMDVVSSHNDADIIAYLEKFAGQYLRYVLSAVSCVAPRRSVSTCRRRR